MKLVSMQKQKPRAEQISFNKNSRELFEELCDWHSCEEGKPSVQYVRHEVIRAYELLLAKFGEFAPMLRAIEKGAKVWERQFSVSSRGFTTKTIDDLLAQHNVLSDGRASHSTLMLPAGYASVETEDDSALMEFSEIYKAVKLGDETIPVLDAKDREKFAERFDKKFYSAQKFDITEQFQADMKEILAEVLLPWHAVASDEQAFGKMLGLLETYHPEVYALLGKNFESKEGISNFIESYAQRSLEEDISAGSLEEKVSASVAKRISAPMIAGLMALAGGAAITAVARDAQASGENDDERGRAGQQEHIWVDAGIITPGDVLWADHPDGYLGGEYVYGDALVYDLRNEKMLALTTSYSNLYAKAKFYVNVWQYDQNAASWSHASKSPYVNGYFLMGTYDAERGTVLAFIGDGETISEVWSYTHPDKVWSKQAEGFTIDTPDFRSFSYDIEHGKVILMVRDFSDHSVATYDPSNGKIKRMSQAPWIPNLATKLIYDAQSKKHVQFYPVESGAVGVRIYDYATDRWEIAPLPASAPQFNENYKMRAAYDSLVDRITLQIYVENSKSFETWNYDTDKNTWAKQSVAEQIHIQKPLAGWHGMAYDRAHNAVLTLLTDDARIYDDSIYTDGVTSTWMLKPLSQNQTPPIQPTVPSQDLEKIKNFTPKILHDSRPDTQRVQLYTPYDPHADDLNITNNHENFDAGKFPNENVVHTKVVNGTSYDYYVYIYERANNPHWAGLAWPFAHEHDTNFAIVKVDKRTDRPVALAVKYHTLGWDVKQVSDVSQLKVYSENGAHEFFTSPLPTANGNGLVLTKDNVRFAKLEDRITDDDINSRGFYGYLRTDEPHPSLPSGVKAPWLADELKDPENLVFKKYSSGNWQNSAMWFELHSPADLEVVVDGITTSKEKSDIPNSGYASNKIGILGISANAKPKILVKGTGSGEIHLYGYSIAGEVLKFDMAAPIKAGQVYEVTPDWQAIKENSNTAVTVRIDANGDGTFEKIITQDKAITADEVKGGKSNAASAVGGNATAYVVGGIAILAVAGGVAYYFRGRREDKDDGETGTLDTVVGTRANRGSLGQENQRIAKQFLDSKTRCVSGNRERFSLEDAAGNAEPEAERGLEKELETPEAQIRHYSALAEKSPGKPGHWYRLAKAYSSSGKWDEAKAAIDKAIEVAGGDKLKPEYFDMAAQACEKLGKPERAQRARECAEELRSSSEKAD